MTKNSNDSVWSYIGTNESSIIDTGEVHGNIVDFLVKKSGELNKAGERVFVIIYMHHNVLIDEIKNGKFIIQEEELKPAYLKELRMFSRKGELYAWKHGQGFKYRLRIDGQGSEINIYEEEHFMWGKEEKKGGKGSIVFEADRGMELELPFAVQEKQLPLKYLVRNYFEFDEHGQIRFVDARPVKFLDKDSKEIYND